MRIKVAEGTEISKAAAVAMENAAASAVAVTENVAKVVETAVVERAEAAIVHAGLADRARMAHHP